MREPVENIVGVHAHHYDEFHDEVMRRIKELKITIKTGDYIKVKFEENGLAEHMWVIVNSTLDNKIVGQLDNEPIVIKNVHYGDVVAIELKKISGYISKDGKIQINPVRESMLRGK